MDKIIICRYDDECFYTHYETKKIISPNEHRAYTKRKLKEIWKTFNDSEKAKYMNDIQILNEFFEELGYEEYYLSDENGNYIIEKDCWSKEYEDELKSKYKKLGIKESVRNIVVRKENDT